MISDEERFREIISEMKSESSGSRGHLYEVYGSSIKVSLGPLSEILEDHFKVNSELAMLTEPKLFDGHERG